MIEIGNKEFGYFIHNAFNITFTIVFLKIGSLALFKNPKTKFHRKMMYT